MKIYIVEDNTQFRETLKTFVSEFLNHEVVGESPDGEHFIEEYAYNADIVLMDINMPNVNGIDATKHETLKTRDLKIIAVSQYTSAIDLQLLIEAGFRGFVSKTGIYDHLEKAIKTVTEGMFYYPEQVQ